MDEAPSSSSSDENLHAQTIPASGAHGIPHVRPATQAGLGELPMTQARSDLSTDAPPTQASTIRRRWQDVDEAPQGPQDPQGPQVGFFFGHSEEEALLADRIEGDGDSIISLTQEEAQCAGCGFVQGISAHAAADPDQPVACTSCGDTKPSKAWLWQSYPEVPITSVGVAYHTPQYCRLLSDAASYPLVKKRLTVMHLPPPVGADLSTLIPCNCPFGDGRILHRKGLMSESGVHYLANDRLKTKGSRWTFDIAQSTGPALAALSAQETVQALLKATKGGVYAPLGDGLFDNMFQRNSQIASIETEAPMPRMHPVWKAPSSAGGSSPVPSPREAGSPRKSSEPGSAASPRSGGTVPMEGGDGVVANVLAPAEVFEKSRKTFETISMLYTTLYEQLRVQVETVFAQQVHCCTPVDFLLQGSDGTLEIKLPTMLKTLSAPLEQRLVWDAIESKRLYMLKYYFSEQTGLLKSITDPLHGYPLGAFEPEFVPGCEGPWSERLTRTVCTREGPNRRGGMDTYQLDVYIDEVLFVRHALCDPIEARLGQILRLHQEFRHITKHPNEKEEQNIFGLLPSHHANEPVPRERAERVAEDLLWHLVKSAVSGVHGIALQTHGQAVEQRWCERPSADGVLGRKTVGALQDFLTFATQHVSLAVAPTWEMDATEDALSVLHSNPEMLARLRFWIACEGLRLMQDHPTPALLQIAHIIPSEWWAAASRSDIPVTSFGREERVALQAVLQCHFGEDALHLDGDIGRRSILLLQMHLLNTRELVQENLELPHHIALLEQGLKEAEAETDILKELVEARRVREQAIDREVMLMRQMLEEWLAIRAESAAPPEHISFGLVQRFPTPDVAAHGPYSGQQLRNKSPQLNIRPRPEPHDNNTQYMCKIFVRLRDGDGSGRYAARTEWKPMARDYRVRMRSLVRLHLAKEPEALLIQVLQRGRAGLTRATPCGYITITPPFGRSPFEPGAFQGRRHELWYPFGSEEAPTAGTLLAEAFWSQHDSTAPSRAPLPVAGNPSQFMDLKTVTKEVVQGLLDPNDPIQQPLMRKLAERHGRSLASSNRRKNAMIHQQEGVLSAVLLPPRRVEPRPGLVSRSVLLQHRWHLRSTQSSLQRTDKQDTRLVGPESKPVPQYPTRRDWARDGEATDQNMADVAEERNDIMGLTTEAWLAKIRKAKAALVKGARRDIDVLRSIVTQPVEETGRNLCEIIADFFKPITKLRPYRKVVDEVIIESTGETPSLLIYVKSGGNVPVRCREHLVESQGAMRSSRPRQSGFGAIELEVPEDTQQRRDKDEETYETDLFVEVRFGPCGPKRSKSTVGPDPLFFETLKLPLPIDDCKHETLSLIDDPIEIRVFDKVKIHRQNADLHRRAEGTTVNYYELKRFIGSCEIPFNTLYCSNKSTWEGVIPLKIPCVALGYAHQKNTSGEETSRSSSISVYITLSPDLTPPQNDEMFDAVHSNEPAGIFWHAQRWTLRCKSQVKSALSSATDPHLKSLRAGRVLGLVHNTDKKAVLLTRFMKAAGMEPPAHLVSEHNPEYMVARFVSLIPLYTKASEDETIWPTSAEMLATGAGSYDDHAVLLANFFTFLAEPPLRRFSEVYVVLGRTDVHIKASFVLTRCAAEKDLYLLWDPVSGDRYTLNSTRCPLRDVALLFNHRNIFCNIQAAGHPRRMDWDVNSGRGWRQLFVGMQESPSETCQTSLVVNCRPIEADFEVRLQLQLTDQIKTLIKELRAPVKTMLTTFRNLLDVQGRGVLDAVILPALEEAHVAGYGLGRGEDGDERDKLWLESTHENLIELHKSALREALSSYDMHGFPLHFAWSNFDAIRKAIVNSGIYLSDPVERLTEFAIGVHVRGYGTYQAQNYCSVWVYVATLKRNVSRWP